MTADDKTESEVEEPSEREAARIVPPPAPRWRPASEPTCCGSGCLDCPF